MNPNYATRVKEEIDKLLRIGFIRPVKQATWLSPIVVVPKKNGKIRVCVDYRKLNAVTVTDAFPLPFTDSVLDAVAGHEMYSFLDGFSGYNQVRMHPNDQEKTAFVTEWGVFVAEVMMFGLKTAPATFQRIIAEVFGEYIPAFMQVFLDDFAVYGTRDKHLHHLRLCLLSTPKFKPGQMRVRRNKRHVVRAHSEQRRHRGRPRKNRGNHQIPHSEECETIREIPGTTPLA